MKNTYKTLISIGMIIFATLPSFGKKTSIKKQAVSGTAKKSNDMSELSGVIKKYRTSPLIKMNVIKLVKSELLGKETKYTGQVYLGHGKFRWDNETPEKTQLIFDGKTIWNVQHPPAELPGPIQIAKAKVDKNTKKQILISTLLSSNGITENFTIKSLRTEKYNDDKVLSVFELEPKKQDLGVAELKLKTLNKKLISEIQYKDDVGNLTTITFDKIEFSEKVQSKLFEYTPPKGAQVTNL